MRKGRRERGVELEIEMIEENKKEVFILQFHLLGISIIGSSGSNSSRSSSSSSLLCLTTILVVIIVIITITIRSTSIGITIVVVVVVIIALDGFFGGLLGLGLDRGRHIHVKTSSGTIDVTDPGHLKLEFLVFVLLMRHVDDPGGFVDGFEERERAGCEVEFLEFGFGGLSPFASSSAVVTLFRWEEYSLVGRVMIERE